MDKTSERVVGTLFYLCDKIIMLLLIFDIKINHFLLNIFGIE